MAEKRIETVEMRAGDVKTGFGNPRKITKKKKDELRNSIETFGDFGSFIMDDKSISNHRSEFLLPVVQKKGVQQAGGYDMLCRSRGRCGCLR